MTSSTKLSKSSAPRLDLKKSCKRSHLTHLLSGSAVTEMAKASAGMQGLRVAPVSRELRAAQVCLFIVSNAYRQQLVESTHSMRHHGSAMIHAIREGCYESGANKLWDVQASREALASQELRASHGIF